MMNRATPAAAVLLGAVMCTDLTGAAAGALAPRRLAIFYGIPSLVNGARGDLARAAAVFAEYDTVVFGDGLELPDVVPGRSPVGAGPVERRHTAAIIRSLADLGRRPAVFGYVDLGRSQNLSQREIERRIGLWREMGAHGIFFDEAGYDFDVTRERQNAAVDAVHKAGMRVFVNAFNPDDVFLPSKGVPHHLKSGDAYLLESFAIRNGKPDIGAAWAARTARALEHARRDNVAVHAVTTTDARTASSPELIACAWWLAVAFGVDAFGWGEPSFSGPDSALPWRPRPEPDALLIGERFVGPISIAGGVYSRGTDRGRIEVDTRNLAGRFVPTR